MNYTECFSSYSLFKIRMKEMEDGKTFVASTAFSDFGKAVFGYHMFSADCGFPQAGPDSPGYAAAIVAALPSAPLMVWMKFGVELRETLVTVESLSDLNSVAFGQSCIRYRSSGLPVVTDYSDAPAGLSKTYAISYDGYRRADRSMTMASLFQYRALDWQFLTGELDPGMIPQPEIPSISVSRPAVMP